MEQHTSKPKVGLITFTDGRDSFFDLPRETVPARAYHQELVAFSERQRLRRGRSHDRSCAPIAMTGLACAATTRPPSAPAISQAQGAECMILCSHFWTPPMLVIDVVREANLPTMLYTVDDPALPGTVSISAVGASLQESGVNQHAVQHERLRGNPARMLPWIRGASAVARMRRSAVMLWGGTYSLHMEHLQDDIPALKRLMIRDILNEGEYALDPPGREDPGNRAGAGQALSSTGSTTTGPSSSTTTYSATPTQFPGAGRLLSGRA